MKFARRSEGIKESRIIFKRAREDANCGFHVSLIYSIPVFFFIGKLINLMMVVMMSGRAWLAQLVRSLPSDQKVPGSISALPKFESLCDLLFRLS